MRNNQVLRIAQFREYEGRQLRHDELAQQVHENKETPFYFLFFSLLPYFQERKNEIFKRRKKKERRNREFKRRKKKE